MKKLAVWMNKGGILFENLFQKKKMREGEDRGGDNWTLRINAAIWHENFPLTPSLFDLIYIFKSFLKSLYYLFLYWKFYTFFIFKNTVGNYLIS